MFAQLKEKTVWTAIVRLGVFFFVFLGLEYLFDNLMAAVTDSTGVVRAQSYVLGVSAMGFLAYGMLPERIRNAGHRRYRVLLEGAAGVLCTVSIMIICLHKNYSVLLLSGCLLFFMLGMTGSAVHMDMALQKQAGKGLAVPAGIAYALGICLQFLDHRFLKDKVTETAVFVIAAVGLLFFHERAVYLREDENMPAVEEEKLSMDSNGKKDSGREVYAQERIQVTEKRVRAFLLAAIVFFMTFIFAELDNAVMLVHAEGSADVGQWPRLLLAVSGLAAGMLYDIRESRYMHMVMYCVMMLSTICMMSMMLGMPFIVGLVVFYLSAGFFSVYFTAGFMEIAPEMKHPGCWAGMGRAVNNFCALITVFITTRFEMGNGYYMMIAAVVLFVVISILLFLYQSPVKEKKSGEQEKQPLSVGNTDENISGTADDTGIDTERCPDSDDSFAAFCGKYGLTQREREVLQALVTSDKTAQEIAHEIGMSRAAFYRHIASLNEKTGTKARVGLLQFYYNDINGK